ncbi:UNKNOWN [Stylonychia lemnae]|uniref:Uncharacterized protein n=1 Tax=Stylonychia lemnae TaxID=5949 RepID=A0A078A9S5_STYLE|nr:UNKNOWN [Stylonychia lemnae]|eukprot:CDW77548.1 UNKNOWN [Stylonychia lemnae]
MGKSMVEKQLDITKIMKDLRNSKVSNNLLLTKSQKELIPFFQHNLIDKQFEKNLVRKEQRQQQRKQRKGKEVNLLEESVQALPHMIDFFVDFKKNKNEKGKIIFDQLFGEATKDNGNLEVQMYRGLFRKYVDQNLTPQGLMVQIKKDAEQILGQQPKKYKKAIQDQLSFQTENTKGKFMDYADNHNEIVDDSSLLQREDEENNYKTNKGGEDNQFNVQPKRKTPYGIGRNQDKSVSRVTRQDNNDDENEEDDDDDNIE